MRHLRARAARQFQFGLGQHAASNGGNAFNMERAAG